MLAPFEQALGFEIDWKTMFVNELNNKFYSRKMESSKFV